MGVGILVVVVTWLVLAVMLFIAPLMIWKHVRRTADAAEAIKRQLDAIIKYLPKQEAALTLEIREVRDVLKDAVR